MCNKPQQHKQRHSSAASNYFHGEMYIAYKQIITTVIIVILQYLYINLPVAYHKIPTVLEETLYIRDNINVIEAQNKNAAENVII